MKVLAEPFWVQKRGCSPEEYEDAACPLERSEYEQSCIRVAVADGATESIYARKWAERLVFAVGDGKLSPLSLADGISRLRAGWHEWLHEWLSGKTLPWFAEEKARQGSFAALVALELTAEKASEAAEGRWHAAAVGDSCLFHVRGKEVLVRFPLANPEAFDSRPYLLSSVGADKGHLNEATLSGTWKKGDVFYLMTDALACWFLKHIDAGGSPLDIQGDFASTNGTTGRARVTGLPVQWRKNHRRSRINRKWHKRYGAVVPALLPAARVSLRAPLERAMEPFRAWVDSLRDQGSIRNDDCTLIRVEIR